MDELRELIERNCGTGRMATAIPRLTLLRADGTTRGSVPTVYQPLFCIVAQGAKRLLVGDRVLVYDAAKYIVVSVDLPVCGEIFEASPEKPYLAVSLSLDRATLASMLLEMADADEDAGSPGMAVHPVTPDVLDPMKRLLRLLDCPRDIPMLAPLAEREVLYRLLSGPQGSMLRQIALADSRLSRVSRAIDWIRRNYDQALRIEALAEVAGMSASSFHRHFKAVTAMSPLQFQKQIRLQEARRLLLTERTRASSIGFAVGYESPSQFSREYSRLFGVPPARDAERLRDLSAREPQHAEQAV